MKIENKEEATVRIEVDGREIKEMDGRIRVVVKALATA